jgi:hypothetical protein
VLFLGFWCYGRFGFTDFIQEGKKRGNFFIKIGRSSVSVVESKNVAYISKEKPVNNNSASNNNNNSSKKSAKKNKSAKKTE